MGDCFLGGGFVVLVEFPFLLLTQIFIKRGWLELAALRLQPAACREPFREYAWRRVSALADGTGHGKERHEPTSARVHGDVLHEERPGCSDGDLQETYHPERRKVTAPRHSNHLSTICSSKSNTWDCKDERRGLEKRMKDLSPCVLWLSVILQHLPLPRTPTRKRATSLLHLHLLPPTIHLQGNPDSGRPPTHPAAAPSDPY